MQEEKNPIEGDVANGNPVTPADAIPGHEEGAAATAPAEGALGETAPEGEAPDSGMESGVAEEQPKVDDAPPSEVPSGDPVGGPKEQSAPENLGDKLANGISDERRRELVEGKPIGEALAKEDALRTGQALKETAVTASPEAIREEAPAGIAHVQIPLGDAREILSLFEGLFRKGRVHESKHGEYTRIAAHLREAIAHLREAITIREG